LSGVLNPYPRAVSSYTDRWSRAAALPDREARTRDPCWVPYAPRAGSRSAARVPAWTRHGRPTTPRLSIGCLRE